MTTIRPCDRKYAAIRSTPLPRFKSSTIALSTEPPAFLKRARFSQGSIQWGPYSTFGAELGLIAGDRRLRLVQLFSEANELKSITLIREQRQGSAAPERPPLQVQDLIGTWQGEAITEYADLRPEQHSKTQLVVESARDNAIRQTITVSSAAAPITSVGTIKRQTISFSDGAQPVQVLLLPDGASSTCPSKITPRQPIFLEVGWLLDAHTRQRLIRTYDAAGAWISLTLVEETKR